MRVLYSTEAVGNIISIFVFFFFFCTSIILVCVIITGECIVEARSKPTVICLRCWSYKAIGRTVSCEAKLANFSRVCSARLPQRERRVSRCLAVSDARRRLLRALLHGGGTLQQSPTRDAAALSIASCRLLWASVSRRPAKCRIRAR